MIHRISNDKSLLRLNILKEVGYVLLLITFFVGVIIGSLNFKNIDCTSFEEYTESLNDIIDCYNSKELIINSKVQFYSGFKIIALYWIAGLSIIGTPILIGYLGYKGFSIGYTVSAIIKLLGIKAGNIFVFKFLLIKNIILVFIMIFLANFSIKISKNFFEKRTNLKADALKYSVLTGIMIIIWIITVCLEKMFLTIF